jgi:predicted transcriptional regulator
MNVNMACLDISVTDLVGCSFGLSKQEVATLMRLLEAKDWTKVASLASAMRRDRSVVQRGLSSLLIKGLVERDQANKPGGGYEFLYRAKDKAMLKRAILDKSAAFTSMVSDTVKRW